MMGLLIKDFKLLKNQKTFFIMMIAIAAWLALFVKNSFLIIEYVTFVGTSFTLSTVSYDEYDNGNAFLFSLPISRKNYIMEKYGFGLIISVGSWLTATVVVVIVSLVRNSYIGQDTVWTGLLFYPFAMILLAVMLPIQFKFGAEKGRIALIGAIGLIYIIVFMSVRAAGLFNVDLISALNGLEAMSMGMLMAIVWGIAAIVLFISLGISVNIMNKKEF